MKKKVMALAVAGALAAPALAFAQASTVQIYGTIRIDYLKLNSGDGFVHPDMMSNYDSNIGLKGEEKLGGGLSTWFQCESSFDGTGESSAANGWCARNSGVGFKGDFGNVFLANWDTPFKIAHGGQIRPFSTAGAFGMASQLFNESASNVTNTTNVTGWSRRQANTINYHSPVFSGFQFLAALSSTDDSTGLSSAAAANKPRLVSFSAMYTNGPLYLGGGYERHTDYNPGAQAAYIGGTDRAWEIAAAYTFAGVFRLGGIYVDKRYDEAASTNITAKAWGIYGDWAIQGPHVLRLGYTVADDTSGTGTANINNLAAPMVGLVKRTDTGARLWAIQYAYLLSKRTELNVGYAKLDNDVNSRHRLQTSAPRNTCAVNAAVGCDRDQNAFVLGVKHTF